MKLDFRNWDFWQSKILILSKDRLGLLTQKFNKSVQNPTRIFHIRIITKCNQWAWNIQTCLKVKRRVMKYLSHTTSHIGCDIWWEKNFIFYVRGPALKARRQTFQDVYNPSTLTKTAFVFFTILTKRKKETMAKNLQIYRYPIWLKMSKDMNLSSIFWLEWENWLTKSQKLTKCLPDWCTYILP